MRGSDDGYSWREEVAARVRAAADGYVPCDAAARGGRYYPNP